MELRPHTGVITGGYKSTSWWLGSLGTRGLLGFLCGKGEVSMKHEVLILLSKDYLYSSLCKSQGSDGQP